VKGISVARKKKATEAGKQQDKRVGPMNHEELTDIIHSLMRLVAGLEAVKSEMERHKFKDSVYFDGATGMPGWVLRLHKNLGRLSSAWEETMRERRRSAKS
jgi:hypothetical protein